MSKKYETITGAELLRADFCSQRIAVPNNIGELTELVTENQFWGNESLQGGLYYDYKNISNRGWTVAQSGWNDFSQDKKQQMDSNNTERWIERNTICENDSTITIIQGYAGCGKTIFVNSLIRRLADNKRVRVVYQDVYIDYDNNSSEDGYLALSIRNHIITHLTNCLCRADGLELYEKYREMITEYGKDYGASFSDVLSILREDGIISSLAKSIYESRDNTELANEKINAFTRQFIAATKVLSGAIKIEYINNKKKRSSFCSLLGVSGEHIKVLLEYYAVLHYLLLCTMHEGEDSGSVVIVYDNLDIIDNPSHVAIFIEKIQKILSKINTIFKNTTYRVPAINVIVAVRKVTYSLLGSTTEVEHSAFNPNNVKPAFLDISNLYSSVAVLKHKAKFLLDNLDNIIPPQYQRNEIKSFLNALDKIPEKTLNSINLSELFNHNIRACANILEYAMKHSVDIIPRDISPQKMTQRCTNAIWIHSICAVLHERDVWKELGYNTESGSIEYYPAALSRLILTLLYNKRRGYSKKLDGYDSVEVSFDEIVHEFETLPFEHHPQSNLSRTHIQKEIVEAYSLHKTRELIINVISEMLKRNTKSDSINPKDEMELWRRPLYFSKNAFPLTDTAGNDNIRRELRNQLSQIDNQNTDFTFFCITDEGYEFIDNIVTNFEFFSIRYNGVKAKPLCYETDPDNLNSLIETVYKQVEACIKDHLWLKDFYIRRYGKSGNKRSDEHYKKDLIEYLSKEFHPKTDNFKSQMHIVRTIFDHIYAINDYRDYLISEQSENYKALNSILVYWIGLYLELYRTYFYGLLSEVPDVSFNETFLDLKYLYWRIINDRDSGLIPLADDSKHAISVNRNSHPNYRITSHMKISDEKLASDPMLLIGILQ